MNDVQRALWLAWVNADKKVHSLIDSKPEPTAANRYALRDWYEEWHTLHGYRDAMLDACILAQVPNMVR